MTLLLTRMLMLWTGYSISDSLTFLVLLLNIKSVRDITQEVQKTFFLVSLFHIFWIAFMRAEKEKGKWNVYLITPVWSIYVLLQ